MTGEKPSDSARRKRQAITSSNESSSDDGDDLFDFDFGDFETTFDETNSAPSLDPDFEPSIDLPLGEALLSLSKQANL